MKLYTNIISLFVLTSTVLSYTLEINKRDEITVDWETYEKCDTGDLPIFSKECQNIYDIVSKIMSECDNAIKKICCFDIVIEENITEDNVKEICDNYHYEYQPECYNLLEEGVTILPECKPLKNDYVVVKNDLLKINEKTVKLICSEDENGNICPLTKYFINDDIIQVADGTKELPKLETQEHLLEESVEATCLSQYCIDTVYDAYSTIVELIEKEEDNENLNKRKYHYKDGLSETDNLKRILNYLESDECTSQTIVPVYTYTDNAFYLTHHNLISLSLSTLLALSFFFL